jgi:hypothetical protein
LAKAKKEGKLQVLNSLNPDIFPHMTKAFKEKFPFIDLQLREITGTETAQCHIHELRAGIHRVHAQSIAALPLPKDRSRM